MVDRNVGAQSSSSPCRVPGCWPPGLDSSVQSANKLCNSNGAAGSELKLDWIGFIKLLHEASFNNVILISQQK